VKEELANRLLAIVMEWDEVQIKDEFAYLNSLSTLKFDKYQQYTHGFRFIESLAKWLGQFTPEERQVAYNFVKQKLVFISQKEMMHLVKSVFPDVIIKELINQVSDILNVSRFQLKSISDSIQFRLSLTKSLFLGLSDGAHIDWFRRSSGELNHEQIYNNYEISSEKAEDMKKNLLERVTSISTTQKRTNNDYRFKNLFLLDDFSGSGLSIIRKRNGKLDGKLKKINDRIIKGGPLGELIDEDDCNISLILYVATKQAIEHIENLAIELGGCWEKSFHVQTLLEIDESYKVSQDYDTEFGEIIKRYYDESVETDAFKTGGTDGTYGFAGCALPLVLYHNTPNNSIFLLFAPTTYDYFGLFPRFERHNEIRGV
jgi:hypothetical protein